MVTPSSITLSQSHHSQPVSSLSHTIYPRAICRVLIIILIICFLFLSFLSLSHPNSMVLCISNPGYHLSQLRKLLLAQWFSPMAAY